MKLPPRQKQVAERLLHAEGMREIGKALRMSPRTVKQHLRHLCASFGIRDWGVPRVRLAMILHLRRHELGIRCPMCSE